MSVHYRSYRDDIQNDLEQLELQIPGVLSAVKLLGDEALKPGALDKKTKELIALGIAVATDNAGGITLHVGNALEAGATPEEIVECLGVVMLMEGEAGATASAEALAALKQFSPLEQCLLVRLRRNGREAHSSDPAPIRNTEPDE